MNGRIKVKVDELLMINISHFYQRFLHNYIVFIVLFFFMKVLLWCMKPDLFSPELIHHAILSF